MKNVLFCIVIISFWLLSGCAFSLDSAKRHPQASTGLAESSGPTTFSAEPYRQQALEYEKSQQLQLALFHWRIAAALQPQHTQSEQRIKDLEHNLRAESEQHYQKGLAYQQKKELPKARREFLAALRYDPKQREALLHLKYGEGTSYSTTYAVKAGDTCQSIAQTVYGSPEMDYIVAYFMEIDPQAKPAPATVVALPVLENRIDPPRVDLAKELGEAKALLEAADYAGVLSILEKIHAHDPANKAAAKIRNDVYYQLGQRLSSQQDCTNSLKMFQKVDPDYKDTRKKMADLNDQIKKNAEMCYHKGINYFVHEELKKAIAEWEKTLALNPEHPKARADIETARNLLEMLKKVE